MPTKKIKDLTEEEVEKICKRYKHNHSLCPLHDNDYDFCIVSDLYKGYCIEILKNKSKYKKQINKEVRVVE